MSKQTTTMDTTKGKDGSVGISYHMLTKSNYTAWSLKMKVYMQAHGIWEAVDSTSKKATIEKKVDKMAMAVIYQGISEDVLLSIADKKTAKEAWEAVKLLCLGADRVKKARIQMLKAEFEFLSMKDTELIDDFCMKLNGLVTNIRSLGETVDESYVVKKLLRAVPAKFLQITSTIEQFGDLEAMSIEEAVGSLKAHEERLRGQSETGGGQLLLTEEEWKKRENSEGQLLLTREEWMKRKNKNETSNGYQSREGGRRDRSKLRCFNCQGHGHFAAECRKPRRERDKEQKVETEVNLTHVQDDEPALLMLECGKEMKTKLLLNEEDMRPRLNAGKQEESNMWYLDNGASNHMTGSRSKFKTLDETVTGQVRFGDGSRVDIKGKGSVGFKCKNGEELVLHDVYFIPHLCNNVISLGQLSENGNKVVLMGVFLWVYDGQGRLVVKVKRSANRLYKLIVETIDPVCLLTKAEESTWLWHARFGHVNFLAMKLMTTEKMAHGLPVFSQPKDVCEGCLMSKQTRRSFPHQTKYHATHALELIHGDLCGPISPETTAGNRYFLLLVDDFTRIMWIYMLKRKDGALGAFKKF